MSKSNIFYPFSVNNSKLIFLDFAAGVKPNPSSIHIEGNKAKKQLQNSREIVANILKARPEEIIFTSGGTESNNLSIQGLVLSWKEKNLSKKLPHIITTNIEHPSVLETCKMLKNRNLIELSIVLVEKNGIIDPKKIKKEIKKNTILVSVMYANNEIGTIQPIREIAKEIRYFRKTQKKVKDNPSVTEGLSFTNFPFFHTDAVQAVNYLDLNVEKLGVDLLSLSGSKIEGAGRVGVLYKKKSVPLVSLFGGGDQEMGLRPGTENLSEIIKFAKALELWQKIKEKEIKRLIKLRDYFISKLENQKQNFRASLAGVGNPGNRGPEKILIFDFLVNGDLEKRLPNILNITFPKIPSDLLVIELSTNGIMASSKSACKSSKSQGSYVIKALREESDSEIGGLRFSLGRSTTKKEIDFVIKVLSNIILKLEKWYQ